MIIPNQYERGVLIVDDDGGVRVAMSARLKAEGFQHVHCAEDGLRALTCLELYGQQIYVIIADIVMPGMDGIKLAEHLTANYAHPTGIIYITGYQNKKKEFKIGDFSESEILSFDLFLKPFNYEDLIHRVLQCGDLVFNRRISLSRYSIEHLSERMDALATTVDRIEVGQLGIEKKLDTLDGGLLKDLGRELLVVALIAVFVVAVLKGLDVMRITNLLK